MSELAELFPEGDYRFHLTLRRGEPREFFRASDSSGRVRAERARWLAENPARYAALTPAGAPLLAEFAAMCAGWGLAGGASVVELGAALEPDFLLLSRDEHGAFRLRGGALCFPTGWALEEKLGHTLDFIHGVVPGLNAALASPIQQFLGKLKPGVAYLRDNWGLAATAELNLHPARALPVPESPTAPDRLWLRVEQQALVALPEHRREWSLDCGSRCTGSMKWLVTRRPRGDCVGLWKPCPRTWRPTSGWMRCGVR
jgi:hypothetical protein